MTTMDPQAKMRTTACAQNPLIQPSVAFLCAPRHLLPPLLGLLLLLRCNPLFAASSRRPVGGLAAAQPSPCATGVCMPTPSQLSPDQPHLRNPPPAPPPVPAFPSSCPPPPLASHRNVRLWSVASLACSSSLLLPWLCRFLPAAGLLRSSLDPCPASLQVWASSSLLQPSPSSSQRCPAPYTSRSSLFVSFRLLRWRAPSCSSPHPVVHTVVLVSGVLRGLSLAFQCSHRSNCRCLFLPCDGALQWSPSMSGGF